MPNEFKFSNLSEEVIKKIFLSRDISKATGMDQISSKFLRDGAEVLIYLTYIVKYSAEI